MGKDDFAGPARPASGTVCDLHEDLRIQPAIAHEPPAEPYFDEAAYLAAFSDVSVAVDAGHCASAFRHYTDYGAVEGRLRMAAYQSAVSRLETEFFPACNIDHVFVTETGTALIEGWIDDRSAALDAVRLIDGDAIVALSFDVSRTRRPDVEARQGIDPGQRVGFWAMLEAIGPRGGGALAVSLGCGAFRRTFAVKAEIATRQAIRRRALNLISHARQAGMSAPEIALQLDGAPGDVLGRIGAALFAAIVAGACCSSFGERRARIRTSVIVRLDQHPQSVFLQAALFSRSRLAAEGELIYVLDGPDLLEHALREAACSARLYGLTIRIVSLPAPVGFGAAIDAAADVAEGERLLVVDPLVLASAPDWLDAHDAIACGHTQAETRIFGAPLGGSRPESQSVEIVVEDGIAAIIRDNAVRTRKVGLLRVASRERWTLPSVARPRSRRVSALSGHFISVDRAFLERIGGFGGEFFSRAAASADLSLRCETGGIPLWEHDLPLLHLPLAEPAPSPEEDAAILLDRWMLTCRWLETVQAARAFVKEPAKRLTLAASAPLATARGRPSTVGGR